MLHLKASAVYLELRRSREAKHAVGEGIEEVHHNLRHAAQVCVLLLLKLDWHREGARGAGLYRSWAA